MPESLEELEDRLGQAIAPAFRGRLLDRGLARGLIWTGGVVPAGSPNFASSLTEDLLDYGHSVLSMALRIRRHSPDAVILQRAFLVAGEAIEAAVHRGKSNEKQGCHRIAAATAFHLARYSARAFSILPKGADDLNFSPSEFAVACLLRRDLDVLHGVYSRRLLDDQFHDEQIAARLEGDDEFDEADAIHEVLLNAFMSGIACFDHATITGSADSARDSIRRLFDTAETAYHAGAVNHWWTATLAAHLIDELWLLSFHQQVPPLSPLGGEQAERWNQLRLDFIQRLRASKRASIELWPSQLQAAKRAVDPFDDLVVALPTSAGKTRIAELCILRTLADGLRVIYVTPLRALSAQVERDLAETFQPLGFSVSTLYGAAGVEAGDSETLKSGKIVVATPEKLDFALRNDPSIIDDVGLIVFDEGHMLGLGEREVRYETLVQRILKRDDAGQRRVVCLSALFPDPKDMEDLVGWIRQDEPGEPVHATWRPTRQRFGTIRWNGRDAARLDVAADQEKSYVRRFIEAVPAPERGRRKNPFPQNDNELTLASAWRFVGQGKRVLIYCALKKSVGTLGELVLKLVEQKVLLPLVEDSIRLRNARSVGVEWLGEEHPAVKCLQYGVALHHGGLPRAFLSEVEALLREDECRLTIASPTLAQGLNLSASVLLVPSIWRNAKLVPVAEFANVIGRAGRAFVDLEGLVLHKVWKTGDDGAWAVRNWNKLVEKAKAPLVVSGILATAVSLFKEIASRSGISLEEVVEYLTGNSAAWDFAESPEEEDAMTVSSWERDVASLDSALLGMIDAECEDDELDSAIEEALEGSLFSRQVDSHGDGIDADEILDFLAARAREIWSQTVASQRRGFYAAGIGLKAGLLLSERLEDLIALLGRIESGILLGQSDGVADAVVEFAEIVFNIAPFEAPKDLPDSWREALAIWMNGGPSASVIEICGSAGVDFVQEAVSYRLPWAMEAVRVHCLATGNEASEWLLGLAPLAVEAGSSNQSVITLMRAGLQSREAARIAVAETGAAFDDRSAMNVWLDSQELATKSRNPNWPSSATRYSWLKFFRGGVSEKVTAWRRKNYLLDVEWLADPPREGTEVVLAPENSEGKHAVLTSGYELSGYTDYAIELEHLVGAWVGGEPNQVRLQYFGPNV